MRLASLAALLGCSFSLAVTAASTAGLFLVYSKPTHPDLTDAVFNEWYTNEHVKDILASGITDLAVRYRNANASAKFPYLAIYRIPDVAKLLDAKVMGSIPATSKLLPGKEKGTTGGYWTDIMTTDIRSYSRVQTFEGQVKKEGRGKGLLTASMEPKAGTEAEFDEWYRKQHLDMLSMLDGYRRSTRYQKLDGSTPKFLAMHEFDTRAVPKEMRLVLGTEWSKKVLGNAVSSSDVWEFITEQGKGAVGEAF